MVKEKIIPRIRRWWKIKPFNRIRKNKKFYNRKKIKQKLKKELKIYKKGG